MDAIEKLLQSFGYAVGEADRPLLSFIRNTVENSIKIRANIMEIPQELLPVVEKRTVGEFLASKLSTGDFKSDSIDLEPLVKTIQEGKVTITYDTSGQTREMMLKTYCGMLIAYGELEIVAYRKLRW